MHVRYLSRQSFIIHTTDSAERNFSYEFPGKNLTFFFNQKFSLDLMYFVKEIKYVKRDHIMRSLFSFENWIESTLFETHLTMFNVETHTG